MKPIRFLLPFLIWLSTFIQAQPEVLRIACVGNSITNGGLGASAYPAQLGVLLGSHFEVSNYGVGGTTLLSKGDYPYRNEAAFYRALEFNPHIVIILLGTNDSKPQNWIYRDEFVSDYIGLVQAFRANGADPQIYIGNSPPVFQEGMDISAQIIREEIVPLMDSIRAVTDTYPIDFYNGMLNHGDLFPDAIHPNATGYGIMAQIAADSINAGPSGCIRQFSFYPDIAEQGGFVSLTWETTSGSAVTLDGNPVAGTDSIRVEQTEASTYTLIAAGATADTAMIIIPYLAPGNIKSFIADPPVLDLGSGDSSTLRWSGSKGSALFLNDSPVENEDSSRVTPEATTTYTLIAGGVDADTCRVTIQVLPPDSINRALNHKITVSSTERGFSAEAAVDGDTATEWQSAGTSTEWINVDLGKEYEINKIVIHWGEPYGTLYHIQALDVAGKVSTIFSEPAGDGGQDMITGLSARARSIRLLAIKNSGGGCVIREFGVYYQPGQTAAINVPGRAPTHYGVLHPNYPNPFNPVTRITYTLPCESEVTLEIMDALGHTVCTLIRGKQQAGSHMAELDGSGLDSGVYIARLKTGGLTLHTKMMLIK